jgi:hypothetical protein
MDPISLHANLGQPLPFFRQATPLILLRSPAMPQAPVMMQMHIMLRKLVFIVVPIVFLCYANFLILHLALFIMGAIMIWHYLTHIEN